MISRGEVAGLILRLVNKTSSVPGFYTADKINDAIKDCLDFVAVEMFLAGEGWQNKLWFKDTNAGDIQIKIPPNIAMIQNVWIKSGSEYLPLKYDDASSGSVQSVASSGAQAYPSRYRIIDNCLYFNPPLAAGETDGLQIEYMTFPRRLNDDHDQLEAHFLPFMHWIKYRAASILVSGHGKKDPDWSVQEAMWYAKVQAVIAKRNAQVTTIREFEP